MMFNPAITFCFQSNPLEKNASAREERGADARIYQNCLECLNQRRQRPGGSAGRRSRVPPHQNDQESSPRSDPERFTAFPTVAASGITVSSSL